MLRKSGCILVAGLVMVTLLSCGCTSTPPRTTNIPPTTPIRTTTWIPTVTSTSAPLHFSGKGISFEYPTTYSPLSKESLQQMQNIMQTQGIELITVLSYYDNSRAIQVGRQPNPATMDSLYSDKKGVADTVNSQGMTVMGERFVRYTVDKISFPNLGIIVIGYAEKSTGQTGISYWVLRNGYEYAIVFTYLNAQAAAGDQASRENIVKSVKFS